MTQYFNNTLLTNNDYIQMNEKIVSIQKNRLSDEKTDSINDNLYNINKHYISLVTNNKLNNFKNNTPSFNNNFEIYNNINNKLFRKSVKYLNNIGKRNHLELSKYNLSNKNHIFFFNNQYQNKNIDKIQDELLNFDFNAESGSSKCNEQILLYENRLENLFDEFYDLLKNNNIKKKFTKIFKSLHKFIFIHYKNNSLEALQDYNYYFKEISDELEKYGFNIRIIFND